MIHSLLIRQFSYCMSHNTQNTEPYAVLLCAILAGSKLQYFPRMYGINWISFGLISVAHCMKQSPVGLCWIHESIYTVCWKLLFLICIRQVNSYVFLYVRMVYSLRLSRSFDHCRSRSDVHSFWMNAVGSDHEFSVQYFAESGKIVLLRKSERFLCDQRRYKRQFILILIVIDCFLYFWCTCCTQVGGSVLCTYMPREFVISD